MHVTALQKQYRLIQASTCQMKLVVFCWLWGNVEHPLPPRNHKPHILNKSKFKSWFCLCHCLTRCQCVVVNCGVTKLCSHLFAGSCDATKVALPLNSVFNKQRLSGIKCTSVCVNRVLAIFTLHVNVVWGAKNFGKNEWKNWRYTGYLVKHWLNETVWADLADF